jgi:hypothetical protein
MGAARIGALRVDLGLNSAAFEKGLDLAQRKLSSVGKQMQKAGEGLQNFGQSMSLAVTAPLVALGATSAQAAIESREAMAQVESALASMGDAAGRTLPQLQEQAAALQKLSTFDDDDILKSVTANLLTFGNVSGDAFDRAQLAAVNLSARLGQDLQSSAIQLGKALNDPIKGVTALSRVGVSFTADQKAMIAAMVEAGNTAGAQSLILDELEKQYGGAAKAARDAAPGSDQIDKWREVQERIGELVLVMGERLLPVVDKILKAFLSLSPEMQTAVVGFAAVAAAIGPVAFGIGTLMSGVGAMLPLFGKMGVVLKIVPPLLSAVGVAFRFMLGPVGLAITAIGLLYLAWKNWDKIEPILRNLYNAVKNWVVDKLNAIWDGVKKRIEAVKGYFYDLYDAVVGHSYVPDMVDGIADQMARLEGVMVKPAASATERSAQAFETMADRVRGILDRLFPASRAQLEFKADVSALEEAFKRGQLTADQFAEAMARLRREHASTMQQIERNDPNTIEVLPVAVEDIPRAFDETMKLPGEVERGVTRPMISVFEQMARGIADSIDDVEGSIRGFVDSIKRGDIAGIIGGIADIIGSITSAIAGFKTGFGTKGPGTTPSIPDFGGARALGGPVSRAKTYLVGERGPELFTADRAGKIVPNNQLGGGGGGGAPYFDLRGAVLTQDLLDQMNAIGNRAAVQGAQMGSQAAMQRFARARDRGLA